VLEPLRLCWGNSTFVRWWMWPLWGPQVGQWIHSRRSRSSMLRRHFISYYPLALLDFLVPFFLLSPIFWNDCVDDSTLRHL